MGGKHSGQRTLENERRIQAEWQQAEQEMYGRLLDKLPGHLVEVRDMGWFTALQVDMADRRVYVWRESEPDNVYPIPFASVFMPGGLIPGAMPVGMEPTPPPTDRSEEGA